MEMKSAMFRFYEELNDFLPINRRKVRFTVQFKDSPGIKDLIESLGIPHTEVDLILVNGRSVDYGYHVENGDDIAVYPAFESFDITPLLHLHPAPLRHSAFILDVHLGRLARYLRTLGFDTLYRNDYTDVQIVQIAQSEHRIVLTRDSGILKYNAVTHGYWVRSVTAREQLREIVRRFDLCRSFKPFSRCPVCNGIVENIDKSKIIDMLEPKTKQFYEEFSRCGNCGKLYWKGSHYEKLTKMIHDICASDRKEDS